MIISDLLLAAHGQMNGPKVSGIMELLLSFGAYMYSRPYATTHAGLL